MKHSPPWEVNRFWASQEIPHISWNPKVHYHSHKCPSAVPTLSQLDSVLTPTSHFLKIHLNIILPSTPGSQNWSLFFRFARQNPVYASHLPHKPHTPCPSHSSRHNNLLSWFTDSAALISQMATERQKYLFRERVTLSRQKPSFLCERS